MSAPAGNLTDKYGSRNPVARRLMAGFLDDLDELLELAGPPGSLLDVGCGEGIVTERFARALEPARVVGVDPGAEALAGEWGAHASPNLEFVRAGAESLPFSDGEFELVAAIEVLEHVPDPEAALREMRRVSSGWLLASVPREPLWRALNMARGAFWRSLGNTPGHLNHWSRRSFAALVREHGRLVELRSPLPWTMSLVRLES